MRSNTRKDERLGFPGEVYVAWDDQYGHTRYANARCVDISDRGLSFFSRDPIPARSYVTFRIEKMNVGGRAAVKHCAKRGAHYLIGLEFAGGLKIKAYGVATEQAKL